MEKFLKKGKGWRLGWSPNAEEYKGLVGSDDWAMELTEAELQDFCRLVTQLAQTMSVMEKELMEEERIACEAESDLIWLEVEGFPHAYTLRVIINQGRSCEGSWSETPVPELIQAISTIKVF